MAVHKFKIIDAGFETADGTVDVEKLGTQLRQAGLVVQMVRDLSKVSTAADSVDGPAENNVEVTTDETDRAVVLALVGQHSKGDNVQPEPRSSDDKSLNPTGKPVTNTFRVELADASKIDVPRATFAIKEGQFSVFNALLAIAATDASEAIQHEIRAWVRRPTSAAPTVTTEELKEATLMVAGGTSTAQIHLEVSGNSIVVRVTGPGTTYVGKALVTRMELID